MDNDKGLNAKQELKKQTKSVLTKLVLVAIAMALFYVVCIRPAENRAAKIAKGLKSPDKATKLETIDELDEYARKENLAEDKVIELITPAIADKDNDVRLKAANTLLQLDTIVSERREAIRPYVEYLAEKVPLPSSDEPRPAVAHDKLVYAFLVIADGDPNPQRRIAAIEAIDHMLLHAKFLPQIEADVRQLSKSFLYEIAQEDGNVTVREAATKVLETNAEKKFKSKFSSSSPRNANYFSDTIEKFCEMLTYA